MLMDSESTKDVNGGFVNNNNNKPVAVASLDGVKVEEEEKGHAIANGGEDDCDSNSLLPPRKGGMSRKSDMKRCSSRKVQWKDKNGNKLVEVLEYEPSDVSDSEDEDDDDDSCICSIM